MNKNIIKTNYILTTFVGMLFIGSILAIYILNVVKNPFMILSFTVISVVLCLLSLTITSFSKLDLIGYFNGIIFVIINIFGFLGWNISLFLMDRNSYTDTYSVESLVIFFSSIIVLSSVFSYIKTNLNLFSHSVLLVYYFGIIFVYINSSTAYMFTNNQDVITEPLYAVISLFPLSVFTYYCIDFLKYLDKKVIKYMYYQ